MLIMLKTITNTGAFVTLLALCQTAAAHPGHDHAAIGSTAIHLLFWGSIIAIGAVSLYLAAKHLRGQKIDKD